MFKRVVLPAPLAPMMAVHVPALKIPVIFLRICFFVYFLVNGKNPDCCSSIMSTA